MLGNGIQISIIVNCLNNEHFGIPYSITYTSQKISQNLTIRTRQYLHSNVARNCVGVSNLVHTFFKKIKKERMKQRKKYKLENRCWKFWILFIPFSSFFCWCVLSHLIVSVRLCVKLFLLVHFHFEMCSMWQTAGGRTETPTHNRKREKKDKQWIPKPNSNIYI